jgi:hypothetical protein
MPDDFRRFTDAQIEENWTNLSRFARNSPAPRDPAGGSDSPPAEGSSSDFVGGGDYGGGDVDLNNGGGGSGLTTNTDNINTAVVNKLDTSKGPFSGPGDTRDGGSQWLRKISLAVYGAPLASSGGGGSVTVTGNSGGTAPPTLLRAPRDPAGGSDSPPAEGGTSDFAGGGDFGGGGDSSTNTGQQQGLELAALRVTFNVHKNTATTPNFLDARVYNMAPATMKKVIQFGRIKLSAGYKYGQYGVIFDGMVVQYRRGKENPTDTYLEIIAADGQKMVTSNSAHRFEQGSMESDGIKTIVNDIGIPVGFMSQKVGTDTLLRPWIVAGSSQHYIRDMMVKYNADTFVDMNKLYIVSQQEYLEGEAVVLNTRTGLVGIPEATPQGMQIRCLLNPRIKIGGLVKLDSEFISGVAFIPGGQEVTGSEANRVLAQSYGADEATFKLQDVPVPTSPIGLYKIYMMEISGDTRGQSWYCDMICLALDANGKPIESPGSVFQRQGFTN